MIGYDYNFVERTQKNLECINEKIKKGIIQTDEDVFYEVTNLINCCLGMVTYVWETTIKKCGSNIKTLEALDEIYKSCSFTSERYGIIMKSQKPNRVSKYNGTTDENGNYVSLSVLIYHMRNAICHGNLTPMQRDSKEEKSIITGFTFQEKSDKTFKAEMSYEQILSFAKDVANAYVIYKQQLKSH